MNDQLETVDQVKRTVIDLAVKFGPKVLVAIIILAIGVYVGRLVGRATDRMLKRLQIEAPVRYLLAASALKLLCERVGVLAIDRKRDSVTIKFTEQATIEPERLARFVAQSRSAQFSPGGVLKFNIKSMQPEAVIDQINGLLRELSPEVVAQTWLQAK